VKRRKSAYGNGRRGCGSLRTRGAASSERYPWLGVGAGDRLRASAGERGARGSCCDAKIVVVVWLRACKYRKESGGRVREGRLRCKKSRRRRRVEIRVDGRDAPTDGVGARGFARRLIIFGSKGAPQGRRSGRAR
jgi:hypothetical protein